MTQGYIEFKSERRDDGKVFLTSPDLPLFSVVGADERAALAVALGILPDYLSANVPKFVELRTIPR